MDTILALQTDIKIGIVAIVIAICVGLWGEYYLRKSKKTTNFNCLCCDAPMEWKGYCDDCTIGVHNCQRK